MANDVRDNSSIIQVPAILRGSQGMVGKCLLEFWPEQSSTGKTYTRCRVVDDPPELPDGQYTLQLPNEQLVRTNKHQGRWALVFLAPGLLD